jgi:hypothetical protein
MSMTPSALGAFTRFGIGIVDVERVPTAARARGALDQDRNREHASWENTVLGNIEIAAGRIVVLVSSDERARAFRDIVERALGSEPRYRDTEIVERHELDAELDPELAAALQSMDAEREGIDIADEVVPEDLTDDPEARAHLARMFEQHYDDWPTQEVPALGGRRPIDVVQEARAREGGGACGWDRARRRTREPGRRRSGGRALAPAARSRSALTLSPWRVNTAECAICGQSIGFGRY